MRGIKPETRSGVALLYVIVIMTAISGFVFLAVDVGHAHIVKNQLQLAADAAARYGATGLGISVATAQSAAVSAAGLNSADGTAVVLVPSTDIQFGTWSGGTFTVLTGAAQSGANSIRITARRSAATSNAVKMYFGPIVGVSSTDITATTTVIYHPGNPSGLTGLSFITTHNNLYVASYNSGSITTPTHGTSSSAGNVYTNGVLGAPGGTGDAVHGNVNLGPSGSVNTVTFTGSNIPVSTITVASPSMSVVVNPGSVSQTPSIANNQTVTWPAGTYYFTSLTMGDGGTINFSGAATVYLDGALTMHDNNKIIANGNIPANLVIYQSSGYSNQIHDNNSIWWDFIGPGSDFPSSGVDNGIHDNDNFYGSLITGDVTFHDNDNFYTDSALAGSVGTDAIVQ